LKVVGGREAQAGEVPAAVRIPDCSATRISKHHLLTAAHCVLDDDRELSEKYAPGKSIRVDYGIRLGDNKNISTIVRRVLVHTSYLEDLEADAASDVALIEI